MLFLLIRQVAVLFISWTLLAALLIIIGVAAPFQFVLDVFDRTLRPECLGPRMAAGALIRERGAPLVVHNLSQFIFGLLSLFRGHLGDGQLSFAEAHQLVGGGVAAEAVSVALEQVVVSFGQLHHPVYAIVLNEIDPDLLYSSIDRLPKLPDEIQQSVYPHFQVSLVLLTFRRSPHPLPILLLQLAQLLAKIQVLRLRHREQVQHLADSERKALGVVDVVDQRGDGEKALVTGEDSEDVDGDSHRQRRARNDFFLVGGGVVVVFDDCAVFEELLATFLEEAEDVNEGDAVLDDDLIVFLVVPLDGHVRRCFLEFIAQNLAFGSQILLILEHNIEMRIQHFQKADPLIQQIVKKNKRVVEVDHIAKLIHESEELLAVQSQLLGCTHVVAPLQLDQF